MAAGELAAGTIVILAVTVYLSRVLSGRLRFRLEKTGFQVNVAILLARSLWLAIWVAGIGSLLYFYGVSPTPLAALVGVVGLAASLSLQQVLQNLVAGVYLLAERPFRIGDVVAVVGPTGLNHVGKVEDIRMRTTHLRSLDDEMIMVPNSAIFTGIITNRSVGTGHAVHITVVFPRSMDLDSARDGVLSLLRATRSVLTLPSAEFRVSSMSRDTWTAVVTFWVETVEAGSSAVWALGHQFPDADVTAQGGTP